MKILNMSVFKFRDFSMLFSQHHVNQILSSRNIKTYMRLKAFIKQLLQEFVLKKSDIWIRDFSSNTQLLEKV